MSNSVAPEVEGAGVASTIAFCSVAVLMPIVQALGGTVHLPEDLLGATTGTVFFASTSVIGALTPENMSLRKALIRSYIAKIAILALVGLGLSLIDIDGPSYAVATAASALVYLSVQTTTYLHRAKLDS